MDFMNNTQALRVVNSFCRGTVNGNCRGATPTQSIKRKVSQDDLTPLKEEKDDIYNMILY